MRRRRKYEWNVEVVPPDTSAVQSGAVWGVVVRIGEDTIPLEMQSTEADANALRVHATISVGDLIDAAVRAER